MICRLEDKRLHISRARWECARVGTWNLAVSRMIAFLNEESVVVGSASSESHQGSSSDLVKANDGIVIVACSKPGNAPTGSGIYAVRIGDGGATISICPVATS
jgi:hypothetical protein